MTRISTNFIAIKALLLLGQITIIIGIVRANNDGSLDMTTYFGSAFGIVVLSAIFYLVTTRKIIKYNWTNYTIHILSHRGQLETIVPIEKVDEIRRLEFSRGPHPYRVYYRDQYGQVQKVTFYPFLLDNYVRSIITDAELRNPYFVATSTKMDLGDLF